MATRVLDAAIVGGGPVGVYLGALLAGYGLEVEVLERRPAAVHHSRAIGIHPPALDAFDRIGVASRVLAEGVRIDEGLLRSGGETFGALSFKRASARYPFIVALPQHRTESLLAERLEEIRPGALRRGIDVNTLEDHGDTVLLHAKTATGGETIRTRMVVGADGGNSFVRSAAGIGVRTTVHRDNYLMGDFADSTLDGPAAVIWLEPDGVVESFPLPGGVRRWVAHTGSLQPDANAAQLCALLEARTGMLVRSETNTMLSAFGVRTQPARRMVAGRVVLVGDAAHQVSPIGGQGMNLGWLDAAALGPILAGLTTAEPDQAALVRFQRRRMRSAAAAGRMAQLNMALGRPARGVKLGARNALAHALLASPARGVLARAYSMRWL